MNKHRTKRTRVSKASSRSENMMKETLTSERMKMQSELSIGGNENKRSSNRK